MRTFDQNRILQRVGERTGMLRDRNRWHDGLCAEPDLADMLDDPIVRILMSRDRVRREDIEEIALRHRG